MAEQLEVYKCDACGNIVEVVHGGGGELVCCGEAMKLFIENTVDAAKEKHVPVIEAPEQVPAQAGYRPRLAQPDLTFCAPYDHATARRQPASGSARHQRV